MNAVHYDRDGRPRCGTTGTVTLTADQAAVTCAMCAGILDGTRVLPRPRGYQWADVKPCGTPAAYRRHYRRGEKPCESCRQAETRRQQDRNPARRERYSAARDAGLTSREALAARDRKEAA